MSPVKSTTCMPSARIWAMASRLDCLTTSATPMTPAACRSSEKYSGVTPEADSRRPASARSSGRAHWVRIKSSLPPAITLPATLPSRPLPGTAWKSPAGRYLTPSSSAFFKMARASGCSLRASSPAARPSRNLAGTLRVPTTSTTVGSPVVTVPVLSSTTVSV